MTNSRPNKIQAAPKFLAKLLCLGSFALSAFLIAALPANAVDSAPRDAASAIIGGAQQTSAAAGMASLTGTVYTDPRVIAAQIIKNAMVVLGFLVVVLIMYAGFLWMTAQGNEEQISKAKKMMTNAVIGLVIIMSAYGVAKFTIDAITKGPSGDERWNTYTPISNPAP